MKRILSIAALLLIATASMANAPKPEAQEQGGKITCIPVSIVCDVNEGPRLSAMACGETLNEILREADMLADMVNC